VDPHFADTCLKNKAKGVGNIIVAGISYGQGSSREHAALCPMYLGVKAVIAKSFERIHAANLINFGILPLVFKEGDDYNRIEKGDRITARSWRDALTARLPLFVVNERTGEEIACVCPLSEAQGATIAAGGLLNYLTSQTGSMTGEGGGTHGRD
jgi:aconitate hydratase